MKSAVSTVGREVNMDLELAGKSIIVKGGVSNIGRAITSALTGEGANVTIVDLDLSQADAVLETISKQGHGAFASISSDASRQGEPQMGIYGDIKAVVNGLMKTVARENGRFGIHCDVVCPGVTVPEQDHEIGESSMWAEKNAMFSEDRFNKFAASLPLKKLGRSGDIANAVAFLSSNTTAGRITGQFLSVSSGYSLVG